MSERLEKRDEARQLLKDVRGFNPSQADRNLAQALEIALDQIAYLMGQVSLLNLEVENLRNVINSHNL